MRKRLPEASTARPQGPRSRAASAGPLSPENPASPLQATVPDAVCRVSSPRDGGNDPIGADLADAAVVVIADEEVAFLVHRDPGNRGKRGLCGEVAVTEAIRWMPAPGDRGDDSVDVDL